MNQTFKINGVECSFDQVTFYWHGFARAKGYPNPFKLFEYACQPKPHGSQEARAAALLMQAGIEVLE
jgi:hypothetical protein